MARSTMGSSAIGFAFSAVLSHRKDCYLEPELAEGRCMKRTVFPLLIAAVFVMLIVVSTAKVTASTSATPVPPTYFGLTVVNSQLTPVLKSGTSRSWDTWPHPDWADINPSAGVYKLGAVDSFIAANVGRDMIYTFGRTPQWASSQPNAHTDYGPGQCAPPTDLANWDSYVRTVVTRAAGRIKYWELWNEPQNTTYYCGDIPTMVKLAQHARQIIKSIDHSAIILSPGVTSAYGPPWLSTFLADGGASTVDVIAFHGYGSSKAEDLLALIARYRAVMAANGVSQLPMWDTEASNGKATADFLSKYYLLHWSAGIARFLWYSYDGAPQWGQIWNPTAGPSAAAIAYTQTYNWMIGAILTSPCAADVSSVWTCEFSRPHYKAKAVWSSKGTATLTVPSAFIEYRDLTGAVHPIKSGSVSVGSDPILIETGPLPAPRS